ncbi:MAG: hypothetical protein ACE5I1_07990 [bacterium]
MESQNIKDVEKLYPDELLAFEVHEVDKMNRAVNGKLLALVQAVRLFTIIC